MTLQYRPVPGGHLGPSSAGGRVWAHKRKHLLSNLKSEAKKAPSGSAPSLSAPSGSAPRPLEEDGAKCPPATDL